MTKAEEFIKKNWDNTIRYNPEDKGNLIGLPFPYTVPCIEGSFQEMYYWDTYFTNVGLILSGKTEQAKNNVNNMAFLIEKYGFMPNGSRTYFLGRSQPPFFSRMVREVYDAAPDDEWLSKMYQAAVKEHSFWQTERMTSSGLNRYYGKISPEDAGSMAEYISRRLGVSLPEDEKSLYELAEAAFSFCESGWDCNSRFGVRPQAFAPIDLNALLYGMEKDLDHFAKILGKESDWGAKAEKRKELLNKLCWNENKGIFCDYDTENERLSDFVSAAAFYPLFVGLATPEQAMKTKELLPLLEQKHGIACSEKNDDLMDLQWDYPHGWACLHFVTIKGLLNYGFKEDARRIAEKYCGVVENNFEKTGNLWEKYNVITGEVSRTKEYSTPSMMGWSAGIYLYALTQK